MSVFPPAHSYERSAFPGLTEDFSRVSQRLPAIKGLAILMVVTYHVWGYTSGYPSFSEIMLSAQSGLRNAVEIPLKLACLAGEQGVHFFLIASGFGLTASWWRHYANQSKRSLERISFWQQRLSRILPLYWLAHGLALALLWINPEWVPFGQRVLSDGSGAITIAVIVSLTTLRNVLLDYYYVFNGAWWYIGLAVQLYLVFPFLIEFGQRRGWSLLLVGAVAISLSYRAIAVTLPLDALTTEVLLRGALFPSRLFEFVFGMVVAIALLTSSNSLKPKTDTLFLHTKTLLLKRGWIPVNLGIWMLGLGAHWAAAEGMIAFRIPSDILIGVGEFCVVFQLFNALSWLSQLFGPVGHYSYGIYLIHMNLFVGLWSALVSSLPSYWLRLCVVVVFVCVLGALFEAIYSWMKPKRLTLRST